MITVAVETGEARNRLRELAEMAGRGRPIFQAAARAVRLTLQQHFRDRDAVGNALGGARTHFWLDVYKSTQVTEVTDQSATVTVGDVRLAQKVYGGTITAKNVSALTIPLRPEAHGRRAAVLERVLGIKLIRVGNCLAARIKGELVAFYALVTSVVQAADAKALPPMAKVEAAALAAAEGQLQSMVKASQRA